MVFVLTGMLDGPPSEICGVSSMGLEDAVGEYVEMMSWCCAEGCDDAGPGFGGEEPLGEGDDEDDVETCR